MKDKQELKKEVWNKASRVDGYPPDVVRQDACGAYMIFLTSKTKRALLVGK